MPRTTYANIRYPALDDVDMNQAFLDLLSDIEYRNGTNAQRVGEVKRRRGVQVFGTFGGINLPHNVSTTCTYDTEGFDTEGCVDLAVSNTNINLTRGLWLISGGVLITNSTALRTCMVELNMGGTVIASSSNGPFSGTANPMNVTTLHRLSATTVLQMIGYQQNAASGTGKIFTSKLSAFRVGIM